MSTEAENPENRKDAVRLLRAEYEAIAASMNTPEARQAVIAAFNAGPEVFRNRPLRRGISSPPARSVDFPLS